MAKTGQIFYRRQSTVNETSARKIQKNAFKRSTARQQENCSPPYVEMAKQVSSKEDQVFASAVYHLVKIANSSRRYRSQIAEILDKYAQTPNLSSYRKNYLAEKRAEINK